MPSQLPKGAQVTFDKNIKKQFEMLDEGLGINAASLVSRLGAAVMKRVSLKAVDEVNQVKRKLSFSRGLDIPKHERDALIAEYLRATEVMNSTQQ